MDNINNTLTLINNILALTLIGIEFYKKNIKDKDNIIKKAIKKEPLWSCSIAF